MTLLLLPRAVTPSGEPTGLDFRLTLVDASGHPTSGLRIADGAPVQGDISGTVDADGTDALSLPILAQSELAIPGGGASYWRLRLRPGRVGVVDHYTVSVPVSDAPIDLITLLSAQACTTDAGAILAARIAVLEANQLPAGAEGDILVHDGTGWKATDELPVS